MEMESNIKNEDGENNNNVNNNDAESVDLDEFIDKNEVWLHFPVFNGIPKEQIANRQKLWIIDRVARGRDQTNAAWSDIYEPNGRIEHMLEGTGGWDIAAIALSDATADEPVSPELLFLDFVKKCLILDPNDRLTTLQLLRHPFISVFGTSEEDALLHGGRNEANKEMMMVHQNQEQTLAAPFDSKPLKFHQGEAEEDEEEEDDEEKFDDEF